MSPALESWGLRVKLAEHVNDRHGYMAGRDEDRAADLHALLRDPEVRGIVCLQGGYGTPRLIPLLDEAAFAANPKILCGYSDLTTLHLAQPRWGDVISFYSNGVAGIGDAGGDRVLEGEPAAGALQRRAVRPDRAEPGRPVRADGRRRAGDGPARRRLRGADQQRRRDATPARLPGPDRRPRGDRARGLLVSTATSPISGTSGCSMAPRESSSATSRRSGPAGSPSCPRRTSSRRSSGRSGCR